MLLPYSQYSTGSISGYSGGFACQLYWTVSLELPDWSDLLEVLEAFPFNLYVYVLTWRYSDIYSFLRTIFTASDTQDKENNLNEHTSGGEGKASDT